MADREAMSMRARRLLGCLSAAAMLGALALPSPATAATRTATQSHELRLALDAVAAARLRWRAPGGWYYERLGGPGRYPLATVWGAVGLFEALDGIAAADPIPAHLRALTRMARHAERYWNPAEGGYAPYPGGRSPHQTIWFDDNGWLGLAFDNAYAVTGNRRWLADAERALHFIAAQGWDPVHGGIWWNTTHPYHAGEAISSATLLAALIYRQTHDPSVGALAQKFMAWADTGGMLASAGLYRRTDTDPSIVDYIQSPLIYAHRVMCDVTGESSLCAEAEQLAARACEHFGPAPQFAPQYDAIYLQWMLALYREDHDRRWYEIALTDSVRAERARNAHGLYLNQWGGGRLSRSLAGPGLLRTQGSTASLFAWVAATAPPRS
jgi:hypothetical protein